MTSLWSSKELEILVKHVFKVIFLRFLENLRLAWVVKFFHFIVALLILAQVTGKFSLNVNFVFKSVD